MIVKNRIVLLLVLLVLMVGCAGGKSYGDPPKNQTTELRYEYIVVDGMPCLIYWYNSTPTCDWSQWDGQVINGEVVIGE